MYIVLKKRKSVYLLPYVFFFYKISCKLSRKVKYHISLFSNFQEKVRNIDVRAYLFSLFFPKGNYSPTGIYDNLEELR